MLISALVSVLTFIAYIAFVLTKFKTIPTSLSETYYMFGESKLKYLFTAMMVICAFTIMPPMIEITRESVQFLAFFCPAAICFVGVAPNFKEEMEGKVHSTSACIAAGAGLLWTAFGTSFWWMILVSIILIGITIYLLGIYNVAKGLIKNCAITSLKSTRIWWLEMIAFLSVYSSLLLELIF